MDETQAALVNHLYHVNVQQLIDEFMKTNAM